MLYGGCAWTLEMSLPYQSLSLGSEYSQPLSMLSTLLFSSSGSSFAQVLKLTPSIFKFTSPAPWLRHENFCFYAGNDRAEKPRTGLRSLRNASYGLQENASYG